MPRLNPSDKLETLRQKMAQLQAQAQALEAREKEKTRKDDTRRKVIVGALALEHAIKNRDSDFARTLTGLMSEYVTRPSDRALFPDLADKAGAA